MQTIVFLLTITALLWHHKLESYSELIEELGCHDTRFRLSCESLNAKIAIFEAIFSQNESFLESLQTSCGGSGPSPDKSSWKFYRLKNWENYFHLKSSSNDVMEVSFRHAINRRMFEYRRPGLEKEELHSEEMRFIANCLRDPSEKPIKSVNIDHQNENMCSGVNSCSFQLSEDIEAALSLGPGAVYLRYACVDGSHLTKACNSNIDVSVEGFVKTPGYPHYYVGDTTCLWTLRALPPQKVKVAFLDVSLRGITSHEGDCLDWLMVSEDGLNLLSTCGDILEDVLIISDGPALNVSFKSSSKRLFPKRGFLFHYKAVGCPSLEKPRDGYLINRNESFAHFRCCAGFIFPDTLTRDKILKCFNENTWNGVILDCVNVTEFLKEKNSSLEIIKDFSAEAREAMEKSDFLKDIAVPSIIICILFVGNGIVLYFIYRQKKKLATAEKIELKEIPNEELDA